MINLIKKYTDGKIVLFLFILTTINYLLMLGISIPKLMVFSNGMKPLDMMPNGYNHMYVNSLLETLGEKGRDYYLHTQIPFDLVYPFLYAITYYLLFAFLLKKINKLDSYLIYFCFLPLFGGFFDYMENLGIINMLKNYPNNSIELSHRTNLFTVIKSYTTMVYFVGLIILTVYFGWKKLLNRKQK